VPTLRIDDKEITVPEGMNLIQAAEPLGIHIPRYCYHPALSVVGSCRMCLVRVEGQPKLVPACNTAAQEGMVVYTKTPEVKEAQGRVLELLLTNHPLDCPVCDQAGECGLQDYAFRYGWGHGRYVEDKRTPPPKDLGPYVKLYTTRCIMCTRCVRFCNEVAGVEELGVFNRGGRAEIDIYPQQPLKNKLSGNVVDICPVGALVDKDFLHRTRVWNLKSFPSICNQCSTGCNVELHVRDNQIYRIKPRTNLEVNGHFICDEGRYSYHQYENLQRVLAPMQRTDGTLTGSDWPLALTLIYDKLSLIRRSEGADAIAGMGSPWATNEENFLLRVLLTRILVSTNVGFYNPPIAGQDEVFKDGFTIHADKSPNRMGAVDIFGGDADLWTKIKKGKIKALYLLGGGLGVTLRGEERRAFEKLEFLIVQDFYLSDAARLAHVVLPGTTFAEKEGTCTNYRGRVQRFWPALQKPGQAWEDWMILAKVIEKFNPELKYRAPEQVFAELAETVEAYRGMSYKKLGVKGLMKAQAAQ